MHNFLIYLILILLSSQFTEARSDAWVYLYNTTKNGENYKLANRPYDAHLIDNYTDNTEEGLYRLIAESENTETVKKAFYALGLVGSINPALVDFEKLKSAVTKLESLNLDASKKIDLLKSGYHAIGRLGTAPSKSFLQRKVFSSSDRDKIPDASVNVVIEEPLDGNSKVSFEKSISGAALSGLVILGREEDLAFLKDIRANPAFAEDYVFQSEIDTLIELHSIFAARHRELLEAYSFSNAAVTTILKTPSDVNSELTQSSDVIVNIKKAAEVAPVETNKEAPEQSSRWWLWLIGALIVLGSGGLVVRRR